MTDEELVRHVQRAAQLRLGKEFKAALGELEPVLAMEHPPASACLIAAECLSMADDVDHVAVESLLRKAVALAPESPDPKVELAHFLYVWNGEEREIRQLLQDAKVDIKRTEISAMLLEAYLLKDEDRLADAIVLLRGATERYPQAKILHDELEYCRIDWKTTRKSEPPA